MRHRFSANSDSCRRRAQQRRKTTARRAPLTPSGDALPGTVPPGATSWVMSAPQDASQEAARDLYTVTRPARSQEPTVEVSRALTRLLLPRSVAIRWSGRLYATSEPPAAFREPADRPAWLHRLPASLGFPARGRPLLRAVRILSSHPLGCEKVPSLYRPCEPAVCASLARQAPHTPFLRGRTA